MTTDSPILFRLGQLFEGELSGLPAKTTAIAKALVVEVSPDGHDASLLLLPVGGRFTAKRAFMPTWRPSTDRGTWYLEKYDPLGTKALWHVYLPDVAAVRTVVMDERQHGNQYKLRVTSPAGASAADIATLKELGVEHI